LIGIVTLGDEFRAYAKERLDARKKVHRQSQSLPIPLHLTEGQLASDPAWNYEDETIGDEFNGP
jgi:hypothetical protein